MNRFDYSWAIVLVVLVAIALMWKPIMGAFKGVSDKATNKDAYERGKIVFYNTTRWAGEGSYKSCAMCHAADFVPEPGKVIKMSRYKPGEPFILKKISDKYGGNIMGTGEELYEACMSCLQAPDKMGCGRISMQSKDMQDLLFYVNKL